MTFPHSEDDHLHEECGVFAIINHSDAAAHTALGLHALQHRGQEGAGIISYHTQDQAFKVHRALGHVGDSFSKSGVMQTLQGDSAIGHVRYSTTGGDSLTNVQPLFAEVPFGGFALAHNGNLTNALQLRTNLVKRGSIFQSTSDTETILHLVATSIRDRMESCLIDALQLIEGAYALICMDKEHVIGVRDPHGIRPLVLGQIGNSYVLASETVALDIIGADFCRDVQPGEMIILDRKGGIRSVFPFAKKESRFCIFEYIYFARPDSVLEGRSVYHTRKQIGAFLAKESHVDADIVVPVPDSGVPAAIGYAEQSGLPFELGIIRNHYVGRTFIEPTDQIRHLGVRLKHNANASYLKGKRVVLVDDSIVRGTTSMKIVELVRAAGATEVHMRIASPPTSYPCFYGVDTPERDKLMAAKHSLDEMTQLIGADSLAFISIDGLYNAAGYEQRVHEKPQFCDACFTGDYPVIRNETEKTLVQTHQKLIAGV